jgi:TP901 family phage tail tape measure protein
MDLGAALGRIEIGYDGREVAAARADLSSLNAAAGGLVPSLSAIAPALGAIGLAGVGAFGAAIGTAAEFERSLDRIASIGGQDALANLQAIEDAALRLGSQTAFSAAEAAAGMEELIKAGLPVADVLDGAAQAALDLSAATGTSVPKCAELMATALNVFGDAMTEYETAGEKSIRIADLFAQAANASATDVTELGMAFAQSALVADQFGIPIEELTAQLGIFANNGLKGSDAGTSFKTMLLQMLDPTKERAKLMAELGLSFFDAQGEFIGLEGVASQLQDSLGGLTEEQRQTALAVLFGSDAVRAASILYEQGAGAIAGFQGEMAAAGTVQEQAAQRLDNLQGALETLRGSLETLAITAGSVFLPALTMLVQGATEVVNAILALPDPILKVVSVLGALASAFAAVTFGGSFLASLPLIGPLFAAIGSAGSALLAVLGPLGIAFGIVAAATAAYRTNFGGLADLDNYVKRGKYAVKDNAGKTIGTVEL